MKKMMQRFKNERGITLVELLAVVVILAIIGTIAFVLIGNAIENSKKDAHIVNAQQMISAAKLYEADGNEIGSGVSAEELETADFLEPLISPWDDFDYDASDVTAEVTKENTGVYKVELDGKNCDINEKEKELLSKDCKEICGED